MFSRRYGDSLKTSFTYFLEDNGFYEFYGVEGAIRGSKCISVYIKKTHQDEFEKLSGKSEVFKDIDTTIVKLQLLGYTVECGKVDIEDDNESVGISTDTKLTIKW